MRPRRGQRGFALMAAVFLIVVLAGAAVTLSRVAGSQQRGAALSLQQARAFHAARSGIEWAVATAWAAGECPPPTTLELSEGGMGGFSVDVSCARAEHADGGEILPIYHLESVARFGALGDPDHVRRRIGAVVVDDS